MDRDRGLITSDVHGIGVSNTCDSQTKGGRLAVNHLCDDEQVSWPHGRRWIRYCCSVESMDCSDPQVQTNSAMMGRKGLNQRYQTYLVHQARSGPQGPLWAESSLSCRLSQWPPWW